MSYNSHATKEENPHAGIASEYLQSNGKRKPVFNAASLQDNLLTAPTPWSILADKEGGKWSLRYGIACVANFLGKVRQQALLDAQETVRKQLQAEELSKHKKLVFQIGRVDFSRRGKTPKYSLDYIPDEDDNKKGVNN